MSFWGHCTDCRYTDCFDDDLCLNIIIKRIFFFTIQGHINFYYYHLLQFIDSPTFLLHLNLQSKIVPFPIVLLSRCNVALFKKWNITSRLNNFLKFLIFMVIFISGQDLHECIVSLHKNERKFAIYVYMEIVVIRKM